jgi:hypothetical protein
MPQLHDLEADHKQMREMFERTVRHFGEDPDKMDSSEFFHLFTRFVESWEVRELLVFQAASVFASLLPCLTETVMCPRRKRLWRTKR